MTVTATDPGGLSAQQSFQVTVANTAPQPVDTIPPLELAAGDSATVDLASYFADPDGDTLTYDVEISDPAVVAVSVSSNALTLRGESVGSADVSVTAADPGGLSAQQSFQVTVANTAPQPVDTIPPLELAAGDSATVDLASYFTDPDGDALTYDVKISDPAVVAASVSGSTLTLRGENTGSTRVTVTATDPDGLPAQQSFQVTVSRPPPPRLTVKLRIEPSQSQFDAFRVLADPTFFADRYDLDVYVVTGDDAATWEFVNDQPITADEGHAELRDLDSGATPQPLEGVSRVRVVYDESIDETHVLLCTILTGRSSQRVEATCSPAPPPPPPPPTFNGSVDLRIEPAQSQFDAFRVLADPTFFAGRYDLDVHIITGDDAATWESVNDQPITADEGRVELQDLNSGATPQPLEDVSRVRVVYDESIDQTHVLLCTILAGRSSQRIEATCSPAPPPPPPPPTFNGSVDVRIEPSQSQRDAFRVLADPTFFAGRYDLDVYVGTTDDAATWEFVNDQPITADEGRVELQDLNSGATPQSLEDVTRVRVVYEEDFTTTHTLICSIGEERSSLRIEAACSTP